MEIIENDFDEELSAKVKRIVGFMNYAYRTGRTLQSIYYDTCDAYGVTGCAQQLFCEFLKANIKNEKLMQEFNSTCFIDEIIFDKNGKAVSSLRYEKLKEELAYRKKKALPIPAAMEHGQTKLFQS